MNQSKHLWNIKILYIDNHINCIIWDRNYTFSFFSNSKFCKRVQFSTCSNSDATFGGRKEVRRGSCKFRLLSNCHHPILFQQFSIESTWEVTNTLTIFLRCTQTVVILLKLMFCALNDVFLTSVEKYAFGEGGCGSLDGYSRSHFISLLLPVSITHSLERQTTAHSMPDFQKW